MEDVRQACKGKPVKITGTTLDLQGCQIVGTRLPQPDNDQDEDSAALRIAIDGFRLQSGSARGIPGGIIFRGDALRFIGLTFLDIGEDGLSNVMDQAPDSYVASCSFFGASDKSLQINDARGLTLLRCTIAGGITGCRLQKKATRYKDIKTRLISGMRFVGCDTAWNISGGVTATESGTKYEGVRTKVVANSGARMISA